MNKKTRKQLERELEKTKIDKQGFMLVSRIAVIGIKSRESGMSETYFQLTRFD